MGGPGVPRCIHAPYTISGAVNAQCLMRTLRYEATCLALGRDYAEVATVTPNSWNAEGDNGDDICDSYRGHNNLTNWTCLRVPLVDATTPFAGDDINLTGIPCDAQLSVRHWFDKGTCTGTNMVCCVK